MKVILFEAVDNLGRPGDIVEVKSGYYRNYLGPRALAEEASPSNLKRLAAKRRQLEAMAASQLEAAKARASQLKEARIEFRLRASEKGQLFGSIGVADIERALAEKKIEIERRDILLKAPIKTLGEHEVGIRLHASLVAPIKVVVEKLEEA
ncbi:MAG: 50S ribosomal protein L9 [Candidatus Sumerlaeota bacterium]|nr:50S ribosomal protein L9 [Candidatus Sumerlaeota bacterium]